MFFVSEETEKATTTRFCRHRRLTNRRLSSFSHPANSSFDFRSWAGELQALEYHELAAEASYLMAMVYDKLGNLEEREEAAALFKKHIIALENPQDVEPNMT